MVLHFAVRGGGVVVEVAGAVRQRVDAGHVEPDLVEAVRGDDVAGEGVAQELRVRPAHGPARVEGRVEARRQGVVDGDQVPAQVPVVAEVAAPRLFGGHRVDEGQPAALLEPGVVDEEERLVLHHGPGEGEPILMAVERRLLRGRLREEVPRVEHLVAQVLEGGAVDLVVARLGGDRHDPRPAAELRGEGPRQHLELADGLDGRGDDDGVEGVLVVVDAVDEPRVRVGLRAERVEVGGAARIEGAGPRQVLVHLARGDARGEIDEGREVATVQRQLAHGALLDHLPHLRGVGARQGRQRGDLGRLRQAAHVEGHVDAGVLVDLEHDASAHVLLEARQLHRHLVVSGDEERRGVGTIGVGHVGAGRALARLGDGDGGPGGHSPRRVLHRTGDRPRRDLGLERRSERDQECQASGDSDGKPPLSCHGVPSTEN